MTSHRSKPLSVPSTIVFDKDIRTTERLSVALPARLTWKDQRGSARFASVTTLDVSEDGVFVECSSPVSISLYRLVQFQLERDVRDADGLPMSIRQGRQLAAVYRVQAPTRAGGRQGLALRLLVDPRRRPQPDTRVDESDAAIDEAAGARATA